MLEQLCIPSAAPEDDLLCVKAPDVSSAADPDRVSVAFLSTMPCCCEPCVLLRHVCVCMSESVSAVQAVPVMLCARCNTDARAIVLRRSVDENSTRRRFPMYDGSLDHMLLPLLCLVACSVHLCG
jgi:hypothetical protein